MRLTFHRAIFWAHLVTGILTGIVILSMAISGLIIAYEVQWLEWINRDLRVTAPTQESVHLDPQSLLTKIREAKPDLTPSNIIWKSDPTLPAHVSAGRDTSFYVNPYTGEILGQGNKEWAQFFRSVISWHRFLTGSGLEKDTGKAITGVASILFGTLLISGIYLWWPRHWRWPNLRAVLLFNRKLKGRARDWNWHNVIGFWSAFPMLLIILSGLVIAYSWATNFLYIATGNEPPPPKRSASTAPASATPKPSELTPKIPLDLSTLTPLLDKVRRDYPEWVTLNLRLTENASAPTPLMVDQGGRGQVQLRTQLLLNVAQQEVTLSPEDITQQNLGRRLRMYARFLHTGELFGLWGQTIASLCAACAAVLVWTGFALAWRRFFKRRSSASH